MIKQIKHLDERYINIIKLVRMSGHRVSIGTQDCIAYRTTHSNCDGCLSEVGCEKVSEIMLVVSNSDKADSNKKMQLWLKIDEILRGVTT